MATTTNLGLYKPTRDDYVSVQRDLSNNYDLIDAAVGQNNILINDMDIIVNGNTASVNVTAGQFVTVRNSTIAGITDGIYKAKNNVAAGTVFTSSNLENITGGVLNTLNEQLAFKDITIFTSEQIAANAVKTGTFNPSIPTGYKLVSLTFEANQNYITTGYACASNGNHYYTCKNELNVALTVTLKAHLIYLKQ